MSIKSRQQRKRQRVKKLTEYIAKPKEVKIVLEEETNKRGRVQALNYLVMWNNKDKE